MTRSGPQGEVVDMRGSEKSWMDGPWPWLAYLPFYVIPWFWRSPDGWQVVSFAIGLAVFLPAYLIGHGLRGTRLIAAASIVLGVGVSLAPMGGNWSVFAIYAAAMAGALRPMQRALAIVTIMAAIVATTALEWQQPVMWWVPGVLLMLTTGAATASREAFYERTQALLRTQEEVRRLAGTAERERIARDLHDVVGRTLTLVALKADLAGKLIVRDPDRAEDELRAIAEAARGGLAEVRAALAGQAGGSLLHEMAASCGALDSAGILVESAGDPADIGDGAGAILAMTLREAVTNVIRHADATRCRIEISNGPDGATLIVTDDGRGGSFRDGNGLTGMRQRLAAAGGSLVIDTDAAGTRLCGRVPA